MTEAGKDHAPGTPASEMLVHRTSATHKRSLPKTLRMAGAAALSATMVGVFALPVSATSSPESLESEIAFAQALTTDGAYEISVPAQLPSAEEQPIIVSYPVVADVPSSGWTRDVAASAVGNALVNAAHAELGVMQDCTDLVQNALAAVGFAERRDQGGYDHGTGSLRGFGSAVTNGEWAPGDILGWPGYPHVALYIGNGLAIHGGMGGSTVVAGATAHFGTPSYVVRPG